MESLFDLAKLMWVLRLLALPNSSLFHQIAILSINQSRFNTRTRVNFKTGPFSALLTVCVKYGLETYVLNMMDTGTLIHKAMWRRMCHGAVFESQERRWQMSRIMYPKLRLFNSIILKIEACVWWTVSRVNPVYTAQCRTVIFLITGENSLNMFRGKYVCRTAACILCDRHETESVSHMMAVCTALHQERVRRWDIAAQSLPQGMKDSVNRMTAEQRTLFLCGGFNCPYTREWQDSYEAVADFIHNMYKCRVAMATASAAILQ